MRSIGIKDLRHGYTADNDWKYHNQDDELDNHRTQLLQPKHTKHGYIGTCISKDAEHWLAHTLGDGLVTVSSASGQSSHRDKTISFSPSYGKFIPGLNHLLLPNHPKVYATIKEWLMVSS